MIRDALGDRMKHNYEDVSKTRLTRRTPVIIRLDGRAFHTFTRGFVKPFDDIMVKTMQDTMKYLCENVQGCVLGYTQSDEITLVLQDYKELSTDAWFDYEVQKMCSIAASMATLAFNSAYQKNIAEMTKSDDDFKKYAGKLNKALFDARCFNIPKEEVNNCLIWRQLDAERNSVNSCAQAMFSHKELQGLNLKDTKAKLETEKGFIWGNLATTLKRGSCCIRSNQLLYHKLLATVKNTSSRIVYLEVGDLPKEKVAEMIKELKEKIWAKNYTNPGPVVDTIYLPAHKGQGIIIDNGSWEIDNEIPRFVDDPDYVNSLIYFGETNNDKTFIR